MQLMQPSQDSPLLRISHLHVRYGDLHALRGVSLDVREREIVAVIGANGAGKSTLLNAISGVIRINAGSINFEGQKIDGRSTQQITQMGICQVPEGRRLFAELSVLDNLKLGAYSRFFRDWNLLAGWFASYRGQSKLNSDLERIFEIFPRLAERRSQLAGSMSGGEQQMVAIGRALMAQPRLLLLDEPSMGLSPRLVKEVLDLAQRLRELGITVLLIEQNAIQALQIADRAYILKDGHVEIEGAASELATNEIVLAAYLGAANFKARH